MYIALTAPGGPPQSLNADSLALGTINISWSPPPVELHYGIITGYQIYYEGANATSNSFTVDLNITLTGLLNSTVYQITVAAENTAGISPQSALIITSTIDPRKLHKLTSYNFYI